MQQHDKEGRHVEAEHEQAQRLEMEAQNNDADRARAICREIRDNASAKDADRLEAVRLILVINGE